MEYRVTGLAAEAAFFVLLSLPPLLLGLVGALGYVDTVIGLDTIDHIRQSILTASATVLSDKGVNQLVRPLLDSVLNGRRPDLVSLGFLVALWSGSRAVNVFVDTITIMYGLEGRRGIVRTRIMSLELYVVALVVGAAVLPLVVIGPDTVTRVLPGGAIAVHVLYWPSALLASVAFLTTLYHLSVPVRSPWYEDVPGALVALFMWVVGSFVLRIYLTHAVEGHTIYGSLAAPVAVLLWIGVSAFAVLVGAAVNAAVDRVWPSVATAAAREENARRREAAAEAVVAQAQARRRARHAGLPDDEGEPPAEYPERWADFLPHRDVRSRLRSRLGVVEEAPKAPRVPGPAAERVPGDAADTGTAAGIGAAPEGPAPGAGPAGRCPPRSPPVSPPPRRRRTRTGRACPRYRCRPCRPCRRRRPDHRRVSTARTGSRVSTARTGSRARARGRTRRAGRVGAENRGVHPRVGRSVERRRGVDPRSGRGECRGPGRRPRGPALARRRAAAGPRPRHRRLPRHRVPGCPGARAAAARGRAARRAPGRACWGRPAAARRRRSGEEVDRVAVRVVDDRVPLAPEGVERHQVARVAGPRQLLVDGVDALGGAAVERQGDAGAGSRLPGGVERADSVDGVPGESQPARQGGLHVRLTVRGGGQVEAEPAVEGKRRGHVGHGQPDHVEAGGDRCVHAPTLVPLPAGRAPLAALARPSAALPYRPSKTATRPVRRLAADRTRTPRHRANRAGRGTRRRDPRRPERNGHPPLSLRRPSAPPTSRSSAAIRPRSCRRDLPGHGPVKARSRPDRGLYVG